ncbi:Bicarbonate transporter BicA [Candidatus Izimaplasma bacterium HR1]|jgi:SulP family sulfate permease|uniref:SulP family inorganic anion transporter n=1 Tax=Candidatus Izimoplasma sp. HR1 TaxID=1541959 RepID=UPI0004F7FB75|nr:Bicarbonate transporter BicA [Candidatus Izimaplasma bacterium HR1]
MTRIINNLFNRKRDIKTELLAGITVSLALVPEAIAFSFVAGVSPLVGLYSAFIVGLLTAIFGGRPGMISGATGALAVVMVELVFEHGVEYLFAAVVVMGLIQILVGLLKLGKFSRIIPETVMLGFVNGLAIVIFLAQLGNFKTDGVWVFDLRFVVTIIIVIITMLMMQYLPKIKKSIPGALIAIVAISSIVFIFNIDVTTVGDLASVKGGLPSFHIPVVPFKSETLSIILPYAFIFASIGLIESLMTLRLVDDITDTRGSTDKECIGQGIANTVTGLFGGMGGCAMIGQSMINVENGGRTRLSGISAALFLLTFILFGSTLIEQIPIAVLTGVMFMVVISTFEWLSFRIIRKIPKSDAFVIILVTVVTIFADLAIAVGLGIVASSLVFAWKKGNNILIEYAESKNGCKEYHVKGVLFFGSVANFNERFDPTNDPEKVIVNFGHARIFDYSGVEALSLLTEKYEKLGKRIYVKNINKDCKRIVKKAENLGKIYLYSDFAFPE